MSAETDKSFLVLFFKKERAFLGHSPFGRLTARGSSRDPVPNLFRVYA
jgi:hypothetical protein